MAVILKNVSLNDLELKYYDAIVENGWHTKEGAHNKGVEACEIMQNLFPELVLKKGVVYSDFDNEAKQYPHSWLCAPAGNIVDPIIMQFIKISPIVYEEKTKWGF